MILVFEGTPGSGKTFEAVSRIIDNLKMGRRVHTNIDGLDQSSCREMICNLTGLDASVLLERLIYLPAEKICNFWEHIAENDFVLIDEVQKFFNSRDFAKSSNREFGSWASTHRHLGQDLILVTQRAERIESSVRSLAEFTYRFRKLNMFGSALQSHYLQYVFGGDDTSSKPLTVSRRKYKKEIFACYQSYFGPQAKEKAFVKGVNVLKHPIFYALAASLILTGWSLSRSSIASGDLFGAQAAIAKVEQARIGDSEVLRVTQNSQQRSIDGYAWVPIVGWLDAGQDGVIVVSETGKLQASDWKRLDKRNRMVLAKMPSQPLPLGSGLPEGGQGL